jgi:putative ABC transport system substrate-binding protein
MDRTRRKIMRAAVLAALPIWSRAASAGARRVALLLGPSTSPDPIGPAKKAWGRGFAEHGFVDGKEIEIAIYRGPSLDYMRAGAADWERVARRAVASQPVLMVMWGFWLSFVRRATRDIPLVFFGANVEVDQNAEEGVDSLRRPGSNVTGFDLFPAQLMSKTLELLKEVRPDATRHAMVGISVPWLDRMIKAEARKLGMDSVFLHFFPNNPAFEDVTSALQNARTEVASFLWSSDNRALHDEFIRLRVAASFPLHASVKAGGLLSYQPMDRLVPRVTSMAARILRGEPVSTIPIEQPREYRLAINLGTAKALGITVPRSILMRAEEIF